MSRGRQSGARQSGTHGPFWLIAALLCVVLGATCAKPCDARALALGAGCESGRSRQVGRLAGLTWDDAGSWLFGARGAEEEAVVADDALLEAWIDSQVETVLRIAEDTYYQMLQKYARSRVVEVAPAAREVQDFGPWTARKDFEAVEADASGEITEWQECYYVTHDWSEYGTAVLSLIPGDHVEINGRTMEVRGIFDYPKVAYSDEIWLLVGNDAVVFQTCEPGSDLNRIAHGSWLDSQRAIATE